MLSLMVLLSLVGAPSEAPTELRVLTYNIHGFGPVAATDEGNAARGRMLRAKQLVPRLAQELLLYRPDVISLQEAASEERVRELAKLLDMKVAYFPGGWKGKGWEEGISGAILSRYPILEITDCPREEGAPRPEIFSRHFGRALLKVGEREVAVYSAHLLPSWKDTTHIRLAEIAGIERAAKQDGEEGRPVVVLGDMNHKPEGAEYDAWKEAGFLDAFFATRPAGGEDSRFPYTCSTVKPDERIDYVFVRGLKGAVRSCRALHEGAFRLHPEDPTSYALSDHLPVLAVIELAKRLPGNPR